MKDKHDDFTIDFIDELDYDNSEEENNTENSEQE